MSSVAVGKAPSNTEPAGTDPVVNLALLTVTFPVPLTATGDETLPNLVPAGILSDGL